MDQLNFSSEDKLLLYCAMASANEDATTNIIEILMSRLNWDYIVKNSIIQEVSPLLYWNLSKIDGGKSVPANILANLRKMYHGTFFRNALLYNELSNILNAFKGFDIDVVVLKGAFLAEVIYKDIGLRPMNDIDLLIKKEDFQRVKMEMAKLMYYPKIFPSKIRENRCTTLSEELQFKNQDRTSIIEIHWDILPVQSPFKIDISKLWENVKPVKIAGIESLMLAPEDILLHLCLHLDKHLYSSGAPSATPLRNYCDIAEVIRHYKETINWSYLLQSSKNYGIEEPIYQGLSVASQCFGAFVPAEILRQLNSVESSVDFENILKTKRGSDPKKEVTRIAIGYLWQLSKVNGIWNKARIISGDAFPCSEYMMQRYSIKNEKQVYVYYVIRFRSAINFGLNILWNLPFYISNNQDYIISALERWR
jgi:hypothetical protein